MYLDNKQYSNLKLRDLVLITVLVSIFFCFMLGNRNLSVPDEGRYVEIPREMVATGNYLTPRLDGVKYFEKPVLFYWLEALTIKQLGIDEFSLRLWPAFFALFGCVAVYAAGVQLFGRRSGLLASVILSTSLLYYSMSRVIILDMPVSVLISFALLSFLVGTHKDPGLQRRLYMWAFYVFAALAVLTKGLIGIVIPGMIIGAWILVLGEWRLFKTLYLPSGLTLFLLIAAPWHIMVIRENPEFFYFYFIHEHFLRYFTTIEGRNQPVWFFLPIILLGMFPWSVFIFQAIRHNLPKSWKQRHQRRDELFLLLWASLVFIFFSASQSKLVPYILPVFPPLAILIGRYIAVALESRNHTGIQFGFRILLVFSLLLAIVFVVAPFFLPAPEVGAIGFYRYAFAATMLTGAGVAFFLTRYRSFWLAFTAVAAMSVLFLVELNAAAPRVELKSIKHLAMELKKHLVPGDKVASYANYYQDLPVYLGRRITVVDWSGELDFGREIEDTSAWMINSATFWKQWQGKSTVYMVTDLGTYQTLNKKEGPMMSVVAKDERNIVLTNHGVSRVALSP